MKLPKFLIKFTGDLYLHKFPVFAIYKPNHHKVKGYEVRKVLDNLKPGDILLRRFDGYLNTIFTPGFWGHAALYTNNNKVVHAIGKGIVEEDILDFCRTDSICILRIKKNDKPFIDKAIKKAYSLIGVEYDFEFDPKNEKFYCTEFVDVCFDKMFLDSYEEIAGNKVLTPDGIFSNSRVEKILVIKH